MKKTILVLAIAASAFMQTTFAQTVKDPISGVLSAYLDLKNALAKDDEKTAIESGVTFFNAIDKVPLDKLTTEQNKVWMKYSKKLSYDAEHIKNSPNIDHVREHFVSLSKNMYAITKAFNTNSANIYYQFCPMANDGKGAYWVSETEKISNPYMGKKMPGCGSTKETVQTKK